MPDIYLIPSLLAENTQDAVINKSTIEIIKNTRVFFVENIKMARRYISCLKLGKVIDDLEFIEVDKDTKFDDLYPIMLELSEQAGILSDAGCPGVADPGALVVEIAHQIGYKVIPLVGPNSILLALMASGFNGQSYAFNGYLPIQDIEREKKIRALEKHALLHNQAQIFIETPYRNLQLYAAFLKNLGPNTRMCIAANLTADDEYIKTASISWWRKQNGNPDIHKKPAIFIIQ